MHCDEGKKLFDFVQTAKNEAGKFRLPPATKPLDTETPSGNSFSSEWIKKKREAEEILKETFSLYQKHIVSCFACHE